MNVDNAFDFLVSALKQGAPLDSFGFEVYIERVIWRYLKVDESRMADAEQKHARNALSPLFYAAAWELCRRGILRPGLKEFDGNSDHKPGALNGYCLTDFGRTWLADADSEALSSVIPGRFVELLSGHVKRFGAGYLSRGTEAIKCYNAHAFVACCAMCGAAAESILLALASERMDPNEVVETYGRAGGRNKIENVLTGKAAQHVQREFHGFMVLITYWRDEAAHGRASNISETEAFTSLMLLLRLARYAEEVFPL